MECPPAVLADSALSYGAKLVAVVLWRYVPVKEGRAALEGAGVAWCAVSRETIEGELAMTTSPVKRAIRELRAGGWIDRSRGTIRGRQVDGWRLYGGPAPTPPRASSGPSSSRDGGPVPTPASATSGPSPSPDTGPAAAPARASTGPDRRHDEGPAPALVRVTSGPHEGRRRPPGQNRSGPESARREAGSGPREGRQRPPKGPVLAPLNPESIPDLNPELQLQVGRARLGDAARELATRVLDAQNERSFPKTWRKATLVVEARLLEGLQHADRDPARAVERVTAIVAGIIRAAQARDADAVKRWGDRMFEPSWLSATEAIASRYREGADGERVAPDGSLVRVYEQPPPPKAPPELPPAEGAF